MRNKRGLLVFLFLSFILVIVLLGLMFYVKLRLGGFEFRTGNIVASINYEKQGENSTLKENIHIINDTIIENNDIIANNESINETNENITDIGYNATEMNETNITENYVQ